MSEDLKDIPESTAVAAEWATKPEDDDVYLFLDDESLTRRVDDVVHTIIEAGMTDNVQMIKDAVFIIGAIPPRDQIRLVSILSKKANRAFSDAMILLKNGNESQRFAYRSIIETMGRVSRHGLLLDAIGMTENDDFIEDVKASLERAQRKVL